MTVPATLTWWRQGEALFAAAAARMSEDDLNRPSRLPGWSRRTVLAHVAGNADALVNLLTWASTGVETPMYASPDARDHAIKAAAALPADELDDLVVSASRRLADAITSMPTEAWAAEVSTAQGRTVPASEVPWMRCREVWVHAIDLDTATSFDDMPDDVLAAIVDDVLRAWARRDQTPDIQLTDGNRTWGNGTILVTGETHDLAAYVTGRGGVPPGNDTSLPDLPSWL